MNQDTVELCAPSTGSSSTDPTPGDSPELSEPTHNSEKTNALVNISASDLASTNQAIDHTMTNFQSVMDATVQKASEAPSYISSSLAAGSAIVGQATSGANAEREQWFGDDVEQLR